LATITAIPILSSEPEFSDVLRVLLSLRLFHDGLRIGVPDLNSYSPRVLQGFLTAALETRAIPFPKRAVVNQVRTSLSSSENFLGALGK